MESTNDTQYPCSKYMHSQYSNVNPECTRMCYLTIILIEVNALDLITPICTVSCKEFPHIITVTLYDTWSNERAENLCFVREGFYLYGSQKKVDIFILIVLYE